MDEYNKEMGNQASHNLYDSLGGYSDEQWMIEYNRLVDGIEE